MKNVQKNNPNTKIKTEEIKKMINQYVKYYIIICYDNILNCICVY